LGSVGATPVVYSAIASAEQAKTEALEAIREKLKQMQTKREFKV